MGKQFAGTGNEQHLDTVGRKRDIEKKNHLASIGRYWTQETSIEIIYLNPDGKKGSYINGNRKKQQNTGWMG